MSKRLWIVLLGLFALAIGWPSRSAELIEIRLTGTAESFQELIGARWWNVRVDKTISGPQPCASQLRVISWTSATPPVIWGSADAHIQPGDRVQIYGRYLTETDGCLVTLMGSARYYIRLPVEIASAEIEIQPSSPTAADEIAARLTVTFTREFGNGCFAGVQLAQLQRREAIFSVVAGEVPPDATCILIYAPTKIGTYTHKLGKLPAGEYRFDLYDFEKLFFSKPFTVVASTSLERALDRNGNNRIDDSEMLIAIDLWIRQEAVPGSGGQRISDAKMITLLNLWLRDAPIE
ncbi:hypothetical protein LM602_08980 [Candidatus Acetothermia bacterium]|jgi:hypothetical protein|nr:hypothetical protein [Candidatus Acetothermia bacterium]MCI2432656.1 hypothetical protein [Candidatus Acetothermia bacterium]MCI2435918.1 hypothetical protein [Candidatus Acetothermia bacterium]